MGVSTIARSVQDSQQFYLRFGILVHDNSGVLITSAATWAGTYILKNLVSDEKDGQNLLLLKKLW